MAESEKLKKVTFALPERTPQKLRELTDSKKIPSANFVVREAVEKYITDLEREEYEKAMSEAAKDPEFLKDIAEAEEAFSEADKESPGLIPPW